MISASGRVRAWAARALQRADGVSFLWEQDSRRDPGAGQGGSGIQDVLVVRAPPTWHSPCALAGLRRWCGAPAPRARMWSRGLRGQAPACSPVRSPVDKRPAAGQRVSGRRPAACGASRTTDSSPPDPRPPLSAQTSTEDADARPPASLGSTLAQSRAPHGSGCPTASPSSGVTVPGPPGHHVPTNPLLPQREKLPSSPTSPHMAMRAVGAAQGGLPVAARPAVASSRLTGVTLGALLRKDQRHPGGALNRLKHLKNLSLQGFLKQKPWPVETQLENMLLDEDSPAK